jgi:hypothetical protein
MYRNLNPGSRAHATSVVNVKLAPRGAGAWTRLARLPSETLAGGRGYMK